MAHNHTNFQQNFNMAHCVWLVVYSKYLHLTCEISVCEFPLFWKQSWNSEWRYFKTEELFTCCKRNLKFASL